MANRDPFPPVSVINIEKCRAKDRQAPWRSRRVIGLAIDSRCDKPPAIRVDAFDCGEHPQANTFACESDRRACIAARCTASEEKTFNGAKQYPPFLLAARTRREGW